MLCREERGYKEAREVLCMVESGTGKVRQMPNEGGTVDTLYGGDGVRAMLFIGSLYRGEGIREMCCILRRGGGYGKCFVWRSTGNYRKCMLEIKT